MGRLLGPAGAGLTAPKDGVPRRTVTISRQTGSGAHIVAEKLAALLQAHAPKEACPWTVFDRNLAEKDVRLVGSLQKRVQACPQTEPPEQGSCAAAHPTGRSRATALKVKNSLASLPAIPCFGPLAGMPMKENLGFIDCIGGGGWGRN